MYKIGDFSRLGQVSIRMLRHYDLLGLLKPEKVELLTGYRYYTMQQLPRLNRILFLKNLGFSLQEVGDLLHDELSLDRMRGMLRAKQLELERELEGMQNRLESVRVRLEQIEIEGKPLPYEVTLKSSRGMAIASVRRIVPDISEMDRFCLTMYREVYRGIADAGIEPLGPEVTLYHSESYTETDLDVEMGVGIGARHLSEKDSPPNVTIRELPREDRMASLLYEGPYMGVVSGVLSLLRWVGLRGLQFRGPMRELHLSGPAHKDGKVQEPALLELQLPIQE